MMPYAGCNGYEKGKVDIDLSSSSESKKMSIYSSKGEVAELEHAQQRQSHMRESTHCKGARAGPHLCDYETDQDNRTNINSIENNQNDALLPVTLQHRNLSIASINIPSPANCRSHCTPQSLSTSISPIHPSSPSDSTDLINASTLFRRTPSTTHHALPTIRRVIAQQGDQARVEYYPQWVSRAWLKNNTPTTVWKEWQEMKDDEECVLSYLPLTGRGYASVCSASRSSTVSGTGTITATRETQEECNTHGIYKPETQRDNATEIVTPWKVLRSEVPNDNDSGSYLAAMLEETIRCAIAELSSRKIHHVLDSPVIFVPGSGSKRRAAELMGRGGMELDITTFLRHLSGLSARERRKFESVKVRWMGQVDERVGNTEGRTHGVSAVAYIAPVCAGWENPLTGPTTTITKIKTPNPQNIQPCSTTNACSSPSSPHPPGSSPQPPTSQP
ncbi:hypothetical protein J1614_000021 [Plenodomus biglobosus]|nr:hypothetical protein J1614_000021 [Plenodomus biglobosus]